MAKVTTQCTPIPDRQTDGQTDEHHGNRATSTIRSMNASHTNCRVGDVICFANE